MSRASAPVTLREDERLRLAQWIRAGATPQQVVMRARIIAEAADGQSTQATAIRLGIHRRTVALWRRRASKQGIGCVWEIAAGRGRKPKYDAGRVTQLVDATLQTKPAGATHWSTRTMAQAHGVSKNTIHRIWQDHGLKPHLTKSYKLFRDPKFLEKLIDVVGVYLTPPQNAVVLCVDEKSQIQALDRTQPGLPLKPGRCGTYTHDYERHGTTTLFAAIEKSEEGAEAQAVAWCKDKAAPFYEKWRAELAALPLKPGLRTAVRRDALVHIMELKIASYRELVAAEENKDPRALRRFFAEQNEIAEQLGKMTEN